MTWEVIPYVREEVTRQGHCIFTLDGIERVGWMLNAWSYALARSAVRPPLETDIVLLGRLIEPVKNAAGFRTCGVRVGPRVCPPHEEVPDLIEELFERRETLSPLDFYREFELIHPFVDGNGRTGKILLNWINVTLLAPIFPPADFWGHPIQNP